MNKRSLASPDRFSKMKRAMLSAVLLAGLLTPLPGVAETKRFPLLGPQAAGEKRFAEVSAKDIPFPGSEQWSVKRVELSGGRQDGVQLIEIDNGAMVIRVIPTRGMNILDVVAKDLKLGWNSPVKEVVHPKYVDLDSRGGLGWLEGFNEWLARCGLEYAGHPGMDEFVTNTGERAQMNLTVHGKISNIPASEAELVVDDRAGTITLRGVVHERMFFGPKLELVTELTTRAGSTEFTLSDVITNRGGAAQEMQLIYHCNFGEPLLEAGAQLMVPVQRIAPMNAHAANSIDNYAHYEGPAAGFIEQVYLIDPRFDTEGNTHALLRNAARTRGCSLTWNRAELPYFTLWKNTAAAADGYVTGLEPATGFPYNRSVERKFGRVPKLQPGEARTFTLTVRLHLDDRSVAEMAQRIDAIQALGPAQIDREPPYVAE